MVKITDKEIAEIIGKEIGLDGRIYWKPEELPEIKAALRAMRLTAADNSFLIDGTMPYWLYIAVIGALAPKKVFFTTANSGQVEIPVTVPSGEGSGVPFRTFEGEDFTLVHFMTPRSLTAEQLASIVPPAVNPAKGVVLVSMAPFWVIGTIAMAYSNAARWIACGQKFGGAIIAISNDRTNPLGTEIDRQEVEEAQKRAAGVPKRGEIWLFDSGYGEHPGLIMSPDARNERSADVLVVPFTSSAARAKHSVEAEPAMTGLAMVCYAKYGNITKVAKEQLIAGPIGRAKEGLMTEIVRNVRLAIGDAA